MPRPTTQTPAAARPPAHTAAATERTTGAAATAHRTTAGRRARRLTALATASLIASIAAPAGASAASASVTDGNLTITDGAAHASVMTIAELANPLHLNLLDQVVISVGAPVMPTPAGCTNPLTGLSPDLTTLICNRSAITALTLHLGDGNDTVLRPTALTILGAQALPVGDLPVRIDAGYGDDTIQGSDAADVIDGGMGDDHLLGFGGGDTITGSGGADTIEPGAGANTVDVSTPEADTVVTALGSQNTISASTNDTIVGDGATNTTTYVGVGVGLDGSESGGTPDDGTIGIHADVDVSSSPGGTSSSVGANVGTAGTTASVAVSASVPSVDDLLRGVRGDVAGGLVPAGVSLPGQPILRTVEGIAGKRIKPTDGVPTPLPDGVTLTPGGLQIKVACTVACQALGAGVVDLGSSHVLTMLPSTVDMPARSAGVLNLRLLGPEYMAMRSIFESGRCAVIGTRVRVRTAAGDDVKSYALPVCGSKVTFALKRRTVMNAVAVTRTVTTTVTCSSACDLAGRFLLVKTGNTVVARVDHAKISAAKGSARIHTAAWTLSTRQEHAIKRVIRGGHTSIRYVVSANATSGGVVTTGSASFRGDER